MNILEKMTYLEEFSNRYTISFPNFSQTWKLVLFVIFILMSIRVDTPFVYRLGKNEFLSKLKCYQKIIFSSISSSLNAL